VKEAKSLGIPALFYLAFLKRRMKWIRSLCEDGIIQKAIRQIKEKVEGILVITDVCLCEYTSHDIVVS